MNPAITVITCKVASCITHCDHMAENGCDIRWVACIVNWRLHSLFWGNALCYRSTIFASDALA